MRYSVYYEIVTPESSELGESDETGEVIRTDSLREAMRYLFETRTAHVDGIECVEDSGYWFSVVNGTEFLTGAHESRTLHVPDKITDSSYSRIARLIGANQS